MKATYTAAAILIAAMISLAHANTTIATFGSASASNNWTFSNGPEFPGATGSLQMIYQPTTGFGWAQLSMNLTQGGNYVLASYKLASPLPTTTAAIVVHIKLPAGIRIFVRVQDATGQTLQYSGTRPPEFQNSNVYFNDTIVITGKPVGFWGGTNNGQITGGITGVGIGMQPVNYSSSYGNTYPEALTGTIYFDNVSAVASNSLTLVGNEPIVGTMQGSPANNANFGVCVHFWSNTPALTAAAQLGASYVRTDLTWANVETNAGQYNFSGWDPLVSNALALGMTTVFALDYGNPLYTGSSTNPPITSNAVAAFANFAKAAAQHFAGKGVSYEIWNEENSAGFWNPVNASNFATLLQATCPSIKSGDSNALVVSGGLSWADFIYLGSVLSTGALDSLNAVGLHPYDHNGAEDQIENLVYFQALLSKRPTAPQNVWITECGVSSTWYGQGNLATPQQLQAQYLLRQVLVYYGQGRAVDNLYDLIDDGPDPTNPENNFGLFSPTLVPTPAGQALQYLNQATAGMTTQGFLQLSDTRVHAFAQLGTTQRVFILWTELPQTFTVNLPPTATITTMYGTPVTPGAGNSITVSGAPQYVFVPAH